MRRDYPREAPTTEQEQRRGEHDKYLLSLHRRDRLDRQRHRATTA
jgi:hypothetical protein